MTPPLLAHLLPVLACKLSYDYFNELLLYLGSIFEYANYKIKGAYAIKLKLNPLTKPEVIKAKL